MKKALMLIAGVAFLICAVGSAQASLIGDEVSLTHYISTAAGTSTGTNLTVVDGSADAWAATIGSSTYYNVNLNASDAYFDFTRNMTYGYAFNGFILDGVADTVTGVSIDTAKTNLVGFDMSRVSFTADSVTVNFAGLYANTNSELGLVFELAAATGGGTGIETNNDKPAMHNPVPAPILLLGTGLAGLAGFRRKNKK